MCISDCRDTATVAITNTFGDNIYGGQLFSMYQVVDDETGLAILDTARADHLEDYPPMIYNADHECRARCAMSSDVDEDFDLFAHPQTNKCGRVCPSIDEVDYYA